MTPSARPPAPLVVARVLVVSQLLAAVLVAVAGGLLAVETSGSSEGWAGLMGALGVGVLVLGLGGGVLLGVPLLVMGGSTPTRRVTGRGLLVMGELLLLVPPLVVIWVRSGAFVPGGTDPLSLVVDVLLVVPVAVVGRLLAPSVGRWVEPAPVTAPAESG